MLSLVTPMFPFAIFRLKFIGYPDVYRVYISFTDCSLVKKNANAFCVTE